MSSPSGFTLVELLIVLMLAGVAVQATLTPLRYQTDLHAVRSGREEVIALFGRARAHAREYGRATVEVREGGDPRVVSGDGREIARAPLSERGVRIEILGRRTEAALAYGPMGVAGFASASLVLRRGEAASRVVVSSFGRVRR